MAHWMGISQNRFRVIYRQNLWQSEVKELLLLITFFTATILLVTWSSALYTVANYKYMKWND